MNKIRLYNDYISEANLDGSIEIEKIRKTELFTVNQLKIKVIKETELLFEFTGDKEVKLDIYLEILSKVKCKVKEEKSNLNSKIRYTYTLKENSILDLKKEYFNNNIRELNLIYLDNNSTLNYNINTISKQRERYDIILYQNYSKSISNINLKVLNLDSTLDFNINNFEEGNDNKIYFQSNVITKNIDLCKINNDIECSIKNDVDIKTINESNNYLNEFKDNKFINEI